MLGGILEKKTCAGCRVCCVFDSSDLWEMPVLDKITTEKMKTIKCDTEFIQKGDGFIVKAPPLEKDELYSCPALGSSGCVLGSDKPFDCKIWPYRVMSVGDALAITLSPVCGAMYSKPLSELVSFLEKGLSEYIFSYAKKHPEVVKDYDKTYPILMTKD